jgi:putative membrane protein
MTRGRALIGLAGFFLAVVVYLMVVRRLVPELPGLPDGGLGALWLFWLFALCHGSYTLGWRHTLVFFAISAVVSWVYEQVGVETGLIYGPYHYGALLGAKLGHVPVIIPVAWFMMIYPSYMLANLIADGAPTGTRGGALRVLWLAALSAMITTAWDVVVDPTYSGAVQAWTWEQGGEYFGVPLQNYVGWLLTTFTVYLIYRFYERRAPPRPVGGIAPFMTAMAVFGYFTFALPTIIRPSIEELRVIALFVMGLPALAAAGRIRGDG